MSDNPSPAAAGDAPLVTPPSMAPTAELLFRFRRLLVAMAVVAVVLAVLPVPSGVPVIVLLVLPVLVLAAAISWNDVRHDVFAYRYVGWLWRFRRDRQAFVAAAEEAGEPVRRGVHRAGLLLALFVAVFVVGLVLAAASAGVSEALYG